MKESTEKIATSREAVIFLLASSGAVVVVAATPATVMVVVMHVARTLVEVAFKLRFLTRQCFTRGDRKISPDGLIFALFSHPVQKLSCIKPDSAADRTDFYVRARISRRT